MTLVMYLANANKQSHAHNTFYVALTYEDTKRKDNDTTCLRNPLRVATQMTQDNMVQNKKPRSYIIYIATELKLAIHL